MSVRTAARGVRRLAGAVLVVSLVAGPGATAGAEPAGPEAEFGAIAGFWSGDGVTLAIDYERMLANYDPDKPFQREALRIWNRSGDMIVFDIGTRRFFAIVSGNQMRVTSDLFAGTRLLIRH